MAVEEPAGVDDGQAVGLGGCGDGVVECRLDLVALGELSGVDVGAAGQT
jgi:hypothetical protein